MMTLTIDIPALDRLCGILEGTDRAAVTQAIEDEIVRKLKEAAEGGVPRPTFETPAEPREGVQEPPKPKPTETTSEGKAPEPAAAPAATAAPAAEARPATLEAVQRAAAQMRDEGKLDAVKALFPEFGINKLSELKGDGLQAFAGRLRGMGAKL